MLRTAATLAVLMCVGCAPAARLPAPEHDVEPEGSGERASPSVAPPPVGKTGPTVLHARLDSIAADTAFRSAIIGVLVVHATTGIPLYAQNAHTALVPASNMKIVTGATAIARLGAGYRYRTTFVLRGAITDSLLNGDLLVFGRGDPSISQRMRDNPLDVLAGVADSLRARGVSAVSGHLVHAGDAFPGPIYGRGWEWAYLTESFAAGVDELIFNEGLSFDPALPAGSDTSSTLPAIDPARAYLEALRFGLQSRGVTIAGSIFRDSLARLSADDNAFELVSPYLSDILAAMAKPSQNQVAEVIFRTLALEATGSGEWAAAANIVTEQLRSWGADTMEFMIRDGSGLSRHNLLSPATIVRVLLVMRAHPEFIYFHAALPAVGSEGTVRNWLKETRAAEVVRGKTGTLDMVRAFSGYATTADNQPVVFSFIANHYRTPTPRVTAAIQEMLQALTETSLSP